MTLDGNQLKQLQNEILNAFSAVELVYLVRTRLDRDLEHIARGENQTETVFALIQWAERHGRLGDLVKALKSERRSN